MIKAVIALVVVVVLTLSVIFYSMPYLAWFSENENVTASGAAVSIKDYGISDEYYYKTASDEEYKEITTWDHVFKGLCPGDSVSIKAVYTNNSAETHGLIVYFGLSVGSSETPIEKDGKYYYLSTQLKITEILKDGEIQSVSGDGYLMKPPADKIAYDTEQTAENVLIAKNISLTSGGRATVEFTVEFVNYPNVDQNVYQGFGNGNGNESCYRQLIAFIGE